jgi:hypothetical protein
MVPQVRGNPHGRLELHVRPEQPQGGRAVHRFRPQRLDALPILVRRDHHTRSECQIRRLIGASAEAHGRHVALDSHAARRRRGEHRRHQIAGRRKGQQMMRRQAGVRPDTDHPAIGHGSGVQRLIPHQLEAAARPGCRGQFVARDHHSSLCVIRGEPHVDLARLGQLVRLGDGRRL